MARDLREQELIVSEIVRWIGGCAQPDFVLWNSENAG